ncbi:MAG: riboflavin synthase [Candidatus Brocadiia bacterium]
MFTGIIQHVGTVVGVRRLPNARVLTVDVGPLADRVSVGDSVSVNGVCLTATSLEGPNVTFDVSAETVSRSSLSELRQGARVNLEPALRAGDPIGGHFVNGHVDGVGTIRRKEERPGEVRLEVAVAPELTADMVMKGSVAVDGISLTVAALRRDTFEASVIPHTMAVTTLQHKSAGDTVNIECDMIGRWVRRVLDQREGAGTRNLRIEDMEEQGF